MVCLDFFSSQISPIYLIRRKIVFIGKKQVKSALGMLGQTHSQPDQWQSCGLAKPLACCCSSGAVLWGCKALLQWCRSSLCRLVVNLYEFFSNTDTDSVWRSYCVNFGLWKFLIFLCHSHFFPSLVPAVSCRLTTKPEIKTMNIIAGSKNRRSRVGTTIHYS